ncbi:Protein kinase superfamily protein [Raphanus sativus]|nr:Protein kinase superfamily protein [Raphanus sativus]
MRCWRRKKKKEKEKETEKEEARRKCFLKNGSTFLQQLIVDCNGISNPIRTFSSDQIFKATDHFDPTCSLLVDPSGSIWYEGAINGRSYSIKRFTVTGQVVGGEEERTSYNDIVLSARVSNHIGFFKLIGCCLEFPLPVMVFEDLEYRALNVRGSLGSEADAPLLPWSATNVFLDKNGTAKLTDFSLAVTLPEGKSWSEEDGVIGTYGYADPIYCSTGILTEYSDVYSFGIFMLVLLTGRPPNVINNGDSTVLLEHVKDLKERGEAVDLGGDSKDMRPGQMNMFLDLALRCCEERNEDRPKMILVAKQIKLIEQASL